MIIVRAYCFVHNLFINKEINQSTPVADSQVPLDWPDLTQPDSPLTFSEIRTEPADFIGNPATRVSDKVRGSGRVGSGRVRVVEGRRDARRRGSVGAT